MKKRIEIYTDGSGNSSNSPGGWGFLIAIDGVMAYEGCGHMETASNNDAELEAALQGVTWLINKFNSNHISPDARKYDITLVSDSQLILGWAQGTNKVKQENKKSKVYDLQVKMIELNAKCRWVRGHSGDEFNERCDRLANAGRLKLLPSEIKGKKKTCIGDRSTGVFSVEYKDAKFVVDLIRKKVERFDAAIHGDRDTLFILEESK